MVRSSLIQRVRLISDDGQEIKVPVLLNGTESVMEFIDLPYPGVSQHRLSIVI